MPKMKQMIKRTEIEQAQRRRKCKFSAEPIEKGSLCLVLHEDSRDRYCYSKDVALKMIEQAKARLSELENELRG
jgi:hypothetical protein